VSETCHTGDTIEDTICNFFYSLLPKDLGIFSPHKIARKPSTKCSSAQG